MPVSANATRGGPDGQDTPWAATAGARLFLCLQVSLLASDAVQGAQRFLHYLGTRLSNIFVLALLPLHPW